ncbi:hypothetical protein U1Q18_040374 [Sarracenia purpurea var. burkii]
MANRFSVLGSIYSDEYDKSYPLLAGTKSETRSNSRVLRAAKRSSPEAILNEADSIRKSLLGVSNLPKYEMSAIRSVAKSIENEVAILRKVEPLDSKRLKALEKRIAYLKRSKSPIRFKPLWDDEYGEDRVKSTKQKGLGDLEAGTKQGAIVSSAALRGKLYNDEEDLGTKRDPDEAIVRSPPMVCSEKNLENNSESIKESAEGANSEEDGEDSDEGDLGDEVASEVSNGDGAAKDPGFAVDPNREVMSPLLVSSGPDFVTSSVENFPEIKVSKLVFEEKTETGLLPCLHSGDASPDNALNSLTVEYNREFQAVDLVQARDCALKVFDIKRQPGVEESIRPFSDAKGSDKLYKEVQAFFEEEKAADQKRIGGLVNGGLRWKLSGILTASFSYGVCGLEFGGPMYGIQLVWACEFLDEFRQAVLLHGRCGGPMGFDPQALLSAGYFGPAAGDTSTLGFYGCGGAPL